MEKREKIIVALVIAAALYGVVDFTLSSQKKKIVTEAKTQTDSQVVSELTAKLSSLASPNDQKIDRLAASLNDPWPEQAFVLQPIAFGSETKIDEAKTAAVNELRGKANKLVYSGFLAMGTERIAIINGMDYMIGDQVNGFTITKIGQDSVQISQQDVTFDIPATLEIPPEEPPTDTPPQQP